VTPPFDPRRVAAIARKEIHHVLRDPFTLAMGLGLPLALVLFFGYVMQLDPREIGIMVQDRDQTRASRQLTELFSASGFFRVTPAPAGWAAAALLDAERAKAVVVIEGGFGRRVAEGSDARIQILIDGADNSSAGTLVGYLAGLQRVANQRLAASPLTPPGRLETRFLYNPELNSRWFVVPGLFVVVTAILAVMLTALTVAREWEMGSMELLLSTPVRPAEIVAGKLAPYLALVVAAIVLVYLMARVVLGVPFRGSHLLFAVSCLLFLVPLLAQGLLISTTLRAQAVAIQVGLISSLLPSMLLSGFIFPIESMPTFFNYLSALLPPRWFMQICRGIFLKDAGLRELAGPMAALLVIGFVLVNVTVRRFKVDLEP
jgi:ABC-2 type transport system permease protein